MGRYLGRYNPLFDNYKVEDLSYTLVPPHADRPCDRMLIEIRLNKMDAPRAHTFQNILTMRDKAKRLVTEGLARKINIKQAERALPRLAHLRKLHFFLKGIADDFPL
jgi:hypothetical protein